MKQLISKLGKMRSFPRSF